MPMKPSWSRVREIAEGALERPPSQRDEFVRFECGDDSALRAEVESLLAAESDSRTLSRFSPTADALDAVMPPAFEPRPGSRIGQFTLCREIASGGMGTVFEATQSNPQRTVALKTMRVGLVDRDALRRFRYEADALARLQHPNIAQVFEAALQPVPYFAMEFVAGARSILAFVKERDLTIEQRLRLFVLVCDAVHYGHQRGVIHRDLKPSNILVDERGTPKVIDYGVARTISDEVTRSLHTLAGEVIGTLQYMGPEQLRGDRDAIDVRADVYSLGAVLHEIACGKPLFDLRDKSVIEAIQALTHTDPQLPSSIDPSLPKDLDWIVAKAVDRERDRRYRSVAELAADIARFLSHEPVEAGPPSGIYRVLKFARRNRLALLSTAAVVLALSSGLAIALREKSAAEHARDAASTEAARANETLEFVKGIFAAVRADTGNRDAKVKDVLDAAAVRIDDELQGQPLVEAAVRGMIGDCYLTIDDVESAAPQLDRAATLRLEHLGELHPDTLRSRLALGNALSRSGRRIGAEAEFRAAAEGLKATLGTNDADTVNAISAHATALDDLGRGLESETRHREAVGIAAQHFEGTPTQAMVESQFALALLSLGKVDEAQEVFERAARRSPGSENANHDYRLRIALGAVQGRLGVDPRKAIDDLVAIHAESEQRLGERHTTTISALAMKGRAHAECGELDEALSDLSHAVELARGNRGDDDVTTNACRNELAKVLVALGRIEEANASFREAIEGATRGLGSEAPETLGFRVSYAIALFGQRRLDDAEKEFRATHEIVQRRLPPTATTRAEAVNWLAETLHSLGKHDEAIECVRPFVEIATRELGEDHDTTVWAMGNLGAYLFRANRFAEAAPVLERLLASFVRRAGEDAPGVAAVSLDLGIARRESGDLVGSESALRRVIDRRRALGDPADPLLSRFIDELATTLIAAGRNEEAESLRRPESKKPHPTKP